MATNVTTANSPLISLVNVLLLPLSPIKGLIDVELSESECKKRKLGLIDVELSELECKKRKFEQKQQKIEEIKASLDEADMLIRKMDLEARSLQPNVKAMLLAKLREYKSDLNNLKREVKKISSPNHDQAREELLEAGMADAYKASADQRERLAFSTERLNQSSERIRESRRTILETEELGISILQDLHQQRETLLHSHAKLHDVDNAIDKSKKILTAMSRRISKNKWMLGSVVGALLLAVIFIVYFKLSH